MKKNLFFLILILFTWSNTFTQSTYFQQEVNVKMEVTLNDNDHTLIGNIEMEYINNSPDVLSEIYMHLWANAYKNRETAFNKQKLRDGSTRFYFAKDKDLGNLSQLDFMVNGSAVTWEYDSDNPDIAILRLENP